MEILDCHDHCVQHQRVLQQRSWYSSRSTSTFRSAISVYIVFSSRFRFDYLETLISRGEKEIDTLESKIGSCEEENHEEKINLLPNYARKIYCGLSLNGGCNST